MLTKVAALSKIARNSFFYPVFSFADFATQTDKQIHPEETSKVEPSLPKYPVPNNIDYNSFPKHSKVIFYSQRLTK